MNAFRDGFESNVKDPESSSRLQKKKPHVESVLEYNLP